MSLHANNVFARQQEIMDNIETNQLAIIQAISSIDGGTDFDQPILKGLIDETNPLYGPLSSITLRHALLVIFATSVGGATAAAVKPILSLLGLSGVTNQDIMDAIDKIDVGVTPKPIRGY